MGAGKTTQPRRRRRRSLPEAVVDGASARPARAPAASLPPALRRDPAGVAELAGSATLVDDRGRKPQQRREAPARRLSDEVTDPPRIDHGRGSRGRGLREGANRARERRAAVRAGPRPIPLHQALPRGADGLGDRPGSGGYGRGRFQEGLALAGVFVIEISTTPRRNSRRGFERPRS